MSTANPKFEVADQFNFIISNPLNWFRTNSLKYFVQKNFSNFTQEIIQINKNDILTIEEIYTGENNLGVNVIYYGLQTSNLSYYKKNFVIPFEESILDTGSVYFSKI